MSNNTENRVLNRMGARQLTQNEIDQINGARLVPTLLSVLITGPASHPDEFRDE